MYYWNFNYVGAPFEGIPTINLAKREKFAIANFTRFTNLTGLEVRHDTTVPKLMTPLCPLKTKF